MCKGNGWWRTLGGNMWALVIWMYGYSFAVPGFESKQLCDKAQQEIAASAENLWGAKPIYVGCVQQSLNK